jgi:peptidoglycan/xylan/chitin deacetylase (PgdA/CDA1 family)
MMNFLVLFSFLAIVPFFNISHAKEIALSFDDAPFVNTKHFDSEKRTDELISKLKKLEVPQVGIFANPCKREDTAAVVKQLKRYKDAGHLIANHTCSHPRFDDVGYEKFSENTERADVLLSPLMSGGSKFFRFPFLNEGKDAEARDQMRKWFLDHGYRNGFVSVDDDDYIFSSKINQAKEKKKEIDYGKVEALFLEHIVGAAGYYDALALKTLGRSPKHVILLHEMDATVLFMESLVKGLRDKGWKIIAIEEAYKDEVYQSAPKNTYGNSGIIAQIDFEKTGVKSSYGKFDEVKKKLDTILGL